MRNKVFTILIICLLTIVLFSGCTENNNKSKNIETKTIHMTAQEFIDDFSFSTSMSGGNMNWATDYSSLNEGDTLILTDKIYNMTYTSFMYNATTIYFDVEDYTRMGISASEVGLLFEGNITDKYSIDDTVRVTLTVKHFVYTNETTGAVLDMEVFEEGWDQNKFMMSFFTQILPETCIEKI